jgi:hypothetical protein
MTRAQTAAADPAVAVKLIELVPRLDAAIGKAILDGIAAGWPQNRAPTLTPEQRTALVAARTAAPAELAASFTAVATRWTLPTVFTTAQ